MDERDARYPLTIDPIAQQAYLKSGNNGGPTTDRFGTSVAVSGDTVVVGANLEDSITTGVNSTPDENASGAGAAYVFVRSGTTWTQQAYLKASEVSLDDRFGISVAVAGDTVVVGAISEDSSTTGVNSPPDELAADAGAAYVFVRSGTTWSQQAYLKASQVSASDGFGTSVAVSGDTVVVGANFEDSSTTGVNSTPNESATQAGAAYVFVRSGTTWTQQAYLKASNAGVGDRFGNSVAVAGDTVVVGAHTEDSSTTGVNSTPDESASDSGAAYVFVRSGATWSQQAYLKASQVSTVDFFGISVAVSGDTVVVGATGEGSSTTGVNSTPDEAASGSGAAYIFTGFGSGPPAPAAPTVASITPTSGTTAGGTSVTITGTGFTGATGVTIGGTAATGVTVVSDTSITCTTPAGTAGTASVVVTTPNGANTANTLYTYVAPTPAPTVIMITPNRGSTAGGTGVIINGNGFTGATGVTIGGVAATSVTVLNGSTITCTTPPGTAGTASVVVTTPNGANAANTLFTYVAPPPAPTVTAISPTSGTTAGGTSVTLTGTGFTGATGVTIGGTAATGVTVVNATTITCITPAGTAGTASVVVTTPNGANTANTLFTYTGSTPAGGVPVAWGAGASGQLGNNATTNSSVPVAVDVSGVLAGKTVTAGAVGQSHSLALTSEGKVYAWGGGANGRLGNNATTDSPVPVPVDISGVLAGKVVTAIASGNNHSLALTSEGKVYAWGQGTSGRLGDNATASRTVPVAVDMSWVLAGKTVTAIAAGIGHSLALTSEGKVYAWGSGTSGLLGNNATTDSPVPVAVDVSGVLAGKTVTAVTLSSHGMALTSEGRVYAWGTGTLGRLGNNATTNSSVPVAVDISGVLAGKVVTAIVAGNGHALVLSSEGKVYAWGFGTQGQLGNNATTNSSVPVAVDISGLLAGQAVTAIAPGSAANHSLVVATVQPAPTVTSIAPTSGSTAGGTSVTLTGTGFTGATGVTIGGTAATSVTVVSATSITCTTPAGTAGTASVVVTTPGGANAANTLYTYAVGNTTPTVPNAIPSFSVLEDAANLVTNLTAVFADLETAVTSLTYAVVANTNSGLVTATITQGTNLTLAFTANSNGTSQISVSATDVGMLSVTNTFVVTVTPVNDQPSVTFAQSTITLLEDAGAQSLASFATFSPGVPANEASQTLLGYTVTVNNPGLFSVPPAINNSGVLTFTPAANSNGSATVTVVVQDNGGTASGGVDKSTNTFTIVVTAVNDAPVAVNNSYTVSQGDVLTVTAAGVLANDTDIENDSLTATRLTDGAQGPVVLNGNGSFTYTPNTNFFGTDSFTYRASDASSNSNPATVSILVHARPTNAVPVAQTVFSSATLRFSATNLPTANAIRVGDPDSTTSTVSLTVTNGTVLVSVINGLTFANGLTNNTNVVMSGLIANLNAALESLAYTSKTNYFGDERLVIVTTDEGGRTNRGNGTVSILVEIPTLGGVPKVSLESLNDPMTGRMITNVTGLVMDTNLVQGITFDSVSNVVNVLPVGGQDGSTNRSTITVRVQFNDGTTRDVVVPVIIYQPLLAATTNAGGTYNSTFGTPLFNYQNSLYEQKVRVQNNTPFDFTAVRITATNLPATVTLQNATLTNAGRVYIDYNLPILSGSNVTLKLEYFSSDLRAFTPGLKLELLNTTRTNTAPPGAVMTNVAPKTGYAPDGLVKNYLYFPSTAGQRYYVQYFDTVTVPQVWKTSGVVIQGTGLEIHWMDDGPPSTETPPGPLRFYRVVTDR